jgi:gamma-glutamyltranspeptidase/glutathione hydrolase
LVARIVAMVAALAVGSARPAQGHGVTGATSGPGEANRGDRYSGRVWTTQIAVDMLERGGSAMDAAIAANATLGPAEPISCGSAASRY